MTEELKPLLRATKKREVCEIPLSMGLVAIVDRADAGLVAGTNWQARSRSDGDGYYAVDHKGTRMHRVLMGASGDGVIVDHVDGNGLNNCRSNLRLGTQSLNSVNRKRTPGPYLRGVRPKKNKWQAYIKVAGKQRSLGYYDTQEEAHAAYLAAAKAEYGDWMPLPLPPEEKA